MTFYFIMKVCSRKTVPFSCTHMFFYMKYNHNMLKTGSFHFLSRKPTYRCNSCTLPLFNKNDFVCVHNFLDLKYIFTLWKNCDVGQLVKILMPFVNYIQIFYSLTKIIVRKNASYEISTIEFYFVLKFHLLFSKVVFHLSLKKQAN